MAIVFCRACKQKITRMDTTCPRCGAPNNRMMPLLLGIILMALCAVFYSAFDSSNNSKPVDVVVSPEPKVSQSASDNIVAGSPEAE